MEIVLRIPDELAAQIQNGSGEPVARRVLELTALEAYRQRLLTTTQLRRMLGFATRYQLDGFLKAHGILFDYSPGLARTVLDLCGYLIRDSQNNLHNSTS